MRRLIIIITLIFVLLSPGRLPGMKPPKICGQPNGPFCGVVVHR